MLITTGGVLIRTRVSEIREMSRATQGVTLINLGAEEKLAGLEKVVETEEQRRGGRAAGRRLPTVRLSEIMVRAAMTPAEVDGARTQSDAAGIDGSGQRRRIRAPSV